MTDSPQVHERCSALLAGHVRGELDATDRAWVDAHLASCSDCAAELIAVQALTVDQGEPRLTELEKSRLRKTMLEQAIPLPDEAASTTGPSEPAGLPSPGRRGRLFQIMGAAAALALIGGFAYLGLGGAGGDDVADTAAGGDASRRSEERSLQDDAAGSVAGETGTGAEESSAADSAEAFAAPPSPTFRRSLGTVDEQRLTRIGKRGLPLVIFSRAYTTADVPTLRDRFVDELAAQAPAARRQDIRDCTALVTAQFPSSLPAYAALGELRGRGDILVVAFAWTDAAEGPLDQAMVWAWSVGDCDGIPVHYSTNVIEPRR